MIDNFLHFNCDCLEQKSILRKLKCSIDVESFENEAKINFEVKQNVAPFVCVCMCFCMCLYVFVGSFKEISQKHQKQSIDFKKQKIRR